MKVTVQKNSDCKQPKISLFCKESLHKKKTQIVWSFTKLGGGTPDETISDFFWYCFKMIYML